MLETLLKALSTLAKLLTQDKATLRDMNRIFLFTYSRPSARILASLSWSGSGFTLVKLGINLRNSINNTGTHGGIIHL